MKKILLLSVLTCTLFLGFCPKSNSFEKVELIPVTNYMDYDGVLALTVYPAGVPGIVTVYDIHNDVVESFTVVNSGIYLLHSCYDTAAKITLTKSGTIVEVIYVN